MTLPCESRISVSSSKLASDCCREVSAVTVFIIHLQQWRRDLVHLNFDLMTGFSLVPLQVFSVAGIAISILSFLFVIFLAVRRLVVGPEVEGVFTLFGILFFLVGVILFGIGLLGEYVGRIYEASRGRPRFLIRAHLRPTGDPEPSDG